MIAAEIQSDTQKRTEAFRLLEQAAESGDPQSQYQLGIKYAQEINRTVAEERSEDFQRRTYDEDIEKKARLLTEKISSMRDKTPEGGVGATSPLPSPNEAPLYSSPTKIGE